MEIQDKCHLLLNRKHIYVFVEKSQQKTLPWLLRKFFHQQQRSKGGINTKPKLPVMGIQKKCYLLFKQNYIHI